MADIAKIIELTKNVNNSLEHALLETMELAYDLGDSELASWVESELNGYKNREQIPDYRTVNCHVRGVLRNGGEIIKDTAIPILHLNEDFRNELTRIRFGQNVSALESLAEARDSDTFSGPLLPEVVSRIGVNMPSDYIIVTAERITTKQQVRQILSTIRGRLLKFLLAIKGKLNGGSGNPKNITRQDTEKLFNSIIMGDGSTVIIGEHNTVTVDFGIKKGDIEALSEFLQTKLGIKQDEINSLRQAIERDAEKKDDHEKKSWAKRILSFAVDGSLKVGVATAAKLISEAISAYLGVPFMLQQ